MTTPKFKEKLRNFTILILYLINELKIEAKKVYILQNLDQK